MNKKPEFKANFIGIGAAKAGTTWLADSLREHPNIYLPKEKELDYFNEWHPYYNIRNKNYKKTKLWYNNFYKDKLKTQICGEISPSYLLSDNAPHEIYAYNPDVKIIVLLRKPIDQLHSLFLFFVQKGFIEKMDFFSALNSHKIMVEGCLYYKYLSRYYKIFDSQNIGVFFYEDLVYDKRGFYEQVLNFLELPHFTPPQLEKRSNVTKEAQFPKLNFVINRARVFLHKHEMNLVLALIKNLGITSLAEQVRDNLNTKSIIEKPTILPKERETVINYYKEDTLKLSSLIQKDLSHWLI